MWIGIMEKSQPYFILQEKQNRQLCMKKKRKELSINMYCQWKYLIDNPLLMNNRKNIRAVC